MILGITVYALKLFSLSKTLWANVIKLFTAVIYEWAKEVSAFVFVKLFQPVDSRAYVLQQTLDLNGKRLPGTNTLAYLTHSTLQRKKAYDIDL
jgi:hypothetical protein